MGGVKHSEKIKGMVQGSYISYHAERDPEKRDIFRSK